MFQKTKNEIKTNCRRNRRSWIYFLEKYNAPKRRDKNENRLPGN